MGDPGERENEVLKEEGKNNQFSLETTGNTNRLIQLKSEKASI